MAIIYHNFTTNSRACCTPAVVQRGLVKGPSIAVEGCALTLVGAGLWP